MAGLYIHIPFCRQQCYYCDFHFTVSLKQRERVIKAIAQEIKERNAEAGNINFQSVYIGGGTPSVIKIDKLADLFSVLYKNYTIETSAEVTLEANPDDLKPEYLELLKQYTPINRLSIGVQSFHDRDLQLMNRLHSAADALKSIENSLAAGFGNLNIDLIYGIPGSSNRDWNNNLKTLRQFNIPHLSAYHLTIEPKTVFAYLRKKAKLREIPEQESLREYRTLMQFANAEGYEHYEISNFARPDFYSRHNLGYWTRETYMGFGPSAHSYNGTKRRWNIANNTHYLYNLENGLSDYFNWEEIDTNKAYNEYVLTSLRTMWGINLICLEKEFGSDFLQYLTHEADKFIRSQKLKHEDSKLYLSEEGKMVADYIISELMIA